MIRYLLLLTGGMVLSPCCSVLAVEFVPLGVGAWETSGDYGPIWNGDTEFWKSFVFPVGKTPEDAFVEFGGVEYLPDTLTPRSPTTVWDSGLVSVFVSDDGNIVAGRGGSGTTMGWINLAPEANAWHPQRLYNRADGWDSYVGVIVGLSADGQTGAVLRHGVVSSDVKIGWNSGIGHPTYVLEDSWYARLQAISGDGKVLAGLTGVGEVYRWSEAIGGVEIVQGLLDVADMSYDGAVMVGGSTWWNENDGARHFGHEPTDDFGYRAEAVSSDGAVIAGTATINGVDQAFRWTESGGMQLLGDLPGGEATSYVTDMSSDGTTIVGMTSTDRGEEPFRWNALTGMQSVIDLLVDGGADLGGYQLTTNYYPTITGVSGDGSVLVGSATMQGIGHQQAWLARIAIVPEPSAALLSVVASGLLATHVRRAATV